MKVIKLGAGLAAGLLAASAHAANLGYTMVGIDLTSTHFDDDLLIGTESFSGTAGASLYGSYQLNDNVFLMLAGQAEGNEEGGFEISSSVGYFGGGFALPVGSQTDVVMRLALVSVEAEVCYNYGSFSLCDSAEDDGYGMGLGLRHMATQNIEVNAQFTHLELDDFDDSDTLTIGGAFWFNPHHSVRLGFGDTEDAKTSALGYRYTF
jgi:hypothetical protein